MKKYIVTSLYQQAEQAFIQGAHANDQLTLEMIDGKYKDTKMLEMYIEYNRHHKTSVSLEVRSQIELMALYDWLQENESELNVPSAIFKEPMLNDSVTGLCFVAPEKLCSELCYSFKSFSDFLVQNNLDFIGLNEDMHFLDKRNNVNIFYKNKDKVFTVVYTNNGDLVTVDYNLQEAKFMIDVRFLRLK